MKKTLVLAVFVLTSLILIPLVSIRNTTSPLTPLPTVNEETMEPEKVRVLNSETNKVEEMSVADYLFGVVAGEMPALYETEALKAQAVAAYTFLKWRQKENGDKEYDITDDFTTDQCYISDEAAREKWGDDYEKYATKIKNAVAEVEGEVITYNGETILSVYHSISSGKTENAKDVWGKEYPYLKAVTSSGDRESEHCVSTATFTKAEIGDLLGVSKFSKKLKNTFKDFARTKSGSVKTVAVGDKEFKGSEIRSLLGLKSSNFEVSYKDEKFTFTVYGYGHGVGMSQNGANEMAKKDKTHKEILMHYYKGAKIEKI